VENSHNALAGSPRHTGRPGYRVRRHRTLGIAFATLLAGGVMSGATPALAAGPNGGVVPAAPPGATEVQSLDGSGNNLLHPEWGQLGLPYSRVAPTNYADGASAMPAGPNTRMISNRDINDAGQNIFSENGVTQWGWAWGQFLDHTFGLAQDGGPSANIAFNKSDPQEQFTNDLGVVPFSRDSAAAGTGDTNARQQVNTVSSYIDAFAVYGGSADRLEWLRDGPVDGNMANNAATMMLPGGYLPLRSWPSTAT
jgi:hypothetical protein